MYCATVMPHLILAKTRTEDDASNNKTIARRLDQWINWGIDSLFLEAKAIQERMSRTKAKRSVDEYKECDKYMSTGKLSNAIRSLTEEAKAGVLSLTEKVDRKRVLDVLREQHPKPCKANLNYVVSNEHPKKLPYHQSLFEKLITSVVRKSAKKTHGSHGPSGHVANEWQWLLISP